MYLKKDNHHVVLKRKQIMPIVNHNRLSPLCDFFILLLISLGFFILIYHDINLWYYSAIGDEYAVFEYGKSIATNKIRLSLLPSPNTVSIFKQNGVYESIPIASTFTQALGLKIFGIDHAGWIMGSVLLVIISFWFFYFYVKDIFGIKIAILSLLIFTSSHYLWAIIHTGYWNIQVYLPFLGALFFYFRGLKKEKALFFFIAGVFSALGFYTYYSARITVIILTFYSLLNLRAFIYQKKLFSSFLFGFLTLFIPFLLVNQDLVFKTMLQHSLFNPTEPNQNFLTTHHLLDNLKLSITGFYKNCCQADHFVSGSLIDPITAFFFSLGLIFMAVYWKKYNFVLLWLFFKIFFIGGFSPYRNIPITRLFFLLPVISIIAAHGLTKINNVVKHKIPSLDRVLIPIIIPTILLLNIYRFYIETPAKQYITPEAITIGAIQTYKVCSKNATVIYQYANGLLKAALESYNIADNVRRIQDVDKINLSEIKQYLCIIFPQTNEKYSAELINQLFQTAEFSYQKFYSPSKINNVGIFLKK